jgi:N6-L-threonylcarbamoyladenine synthase
MKAKLPVILAIESSCDDTSIAILEGLNVCSNVTASQQIHAEFGGVVPELASRAHQQHIVPAVQKALWDSGKTLQDLTHIAYTQGPGLLGSLLVGASFAKGLALSKGLPLVPVNHMEAHVLALTLSDADYLQRPGIEFPFLCLTVSGGHSQLVWVSDPLTIQLLGETKDDAAGEAFDKGAKLLGLPYPGGPVVDRIAATGMLGTHRFPLPKVPAMHFSFSGLKTSLLYWIQKNGRPKSEQDLANLLADYQEAIIDVLMKGLEEARMYTKTPRVALAGGVSANSRLRVRVEEWANKHNIELRIPKLGYCTDNGAMIGAAAYWKIQHGLLGSHSDQAQARMPLPFQPHL